MSWWILPVHGEEPDHLLAADLFWCWAGPPQQDRGLRPGGDGRIGPGKICLKLMKKKLRRPGTRFLFDWGMLY